MIERRLLSRGQRSVRFFINPRAGDGWEFTSIQGKKGQLSARREPVFR
jgi:hypothetical protein